MSIGHPDYGQSAPLARVTPLTDLGELAARLGSIDLFSRSGTLLFLTGFDDGLAEFQSVAAGVGASVALDTTLAFKGKQSVKLTAGSDVGGEQALLRKFFPVLSVGRVGIEWMFNTPNTIDRVEFTVYYYDGSYTWRFEIQFVWTGQKLRVLDTSGYVDIAPLSFGTFSPWFFHHFKMILDLDTVRYRRVYFDQQEFILTDYVPTNIVNVTDPLLSVYLSLYGRNGFNDYLNADSFILTINEP